MPAHTASLQRRNRTKNAQPLPRQRLYHQLYAQQNSHSQDPSRQENAQEPNGGQSPYIYTITNSTLRGQSMPPRTSLEKSEKLSSLHKINSENCPANYVGETEKMLET